MIDGAAAHPEGINRLFNVLAFIFPAAEQFHAADTGNLEHFADTGNRIIGNDIHKLLRELIRLHDVVLVLPRMGRRIAVQAYLTLVLDGIGKGFHNVELGFVVDIIGNGRRVINSRQLMLKTGFQRIGAIQIFNQMAENDGFLFREIDQFSLLNTLVAYMVTNSASFGIDSPWE